MTAAHPQPPEPRVFAVRHGKTEWSENGRHTSRTDLPLLPAGVERAKGLARTLNPDDFELVLSSPLMRARQTAELAGFAIERTEICEDLHEWDYGDYEGLTSPQIHAQDPGWSLWTDGAPGGESPVEVAARADRVIERAVKSQGDVIVFAHGHILRVLGARWIGLGADAGSLLMLDPATISRLGHEHGQRAIQGWNAEPH
jgi:broad specificity phosphatase PhoE